MTHRSISRYQRRSCSSKNCIKIKLYHPLFGISNCQRNCLNIGGIDVEAVLAKIVKSDPPLNKSEVRQVGRQEAPNQSAELSAEVHSL